MRPLMVFEYFDRFEASCPMYYQQKILKFKCRVKTKNLKSKSNCQKTTTNPKLKSNVEQIQQQHRKHNLGSRQIGMDKAHL
jgi:hypothetical protein